MASPEEWGTIESDTGMFTNIVESFGVRASEFVELWSFDDNSICSLIYNYVDFYCLIFLFKCQSSADDNSSNKNNEG